MNERSIKTISTSRLFDGSEWLDNVTIVIEDCRIIDIVDIRNAPGSNSSHNLFKGFVAPGLLDLQVNGGGGLLFNNEPTFQNLKVIADGHASAGTARIMPTVITDKPDITKKAIKSAIEANNNLPLGTVGVHVEGPFFSSERRGVHREEDIRRLTAEDWPWIEMASSIPSIITLAPEMVSLDIIRVMGELGINVCAGHTNATYEEMALAIEAGVSGFTHLFNAMSPLTSREPGVVGAALLDADTWCGVIADGVHVHPSSLQVAMKLKPSGKVFLVSDSMATIGSGTNSFELYGEHIVKRNSRLVNSLGRLAGSAISLLDAVKYCHRVLGVELGEAIAMASKYPAEFIGQSGNYGSIRVGAVADVTWFDDSLNVLGVWRAGELFQNEVTI